MPPPIRRCAKHLTKRLPSPPICLRMKTETIGRSTTMPTAKLHRPIHWPPTMPTAANSSLKPPTAVFRLPLRPLPTHRPPQPSIRNRIFQAAPKQDWKTKPKRRRQGSLKACKARLQTPILKKIFGAFGTISNKCSRIITTPAAAMRWRRRGRRYAMRWTVCPWAAATKRRRFALLFYATTASNIPKYGRSGRTISAGVKMCAAPRLRPKNCSSWCCTAAAWHGWKDAGTTDMAGKRRRKTAKGSLKIPASAIRMTPIRPTPIRRRPTIRRCWYRSWNICMPKAAALCCLRAGRRLAGRSTICRWAPPSRLPTLLPAFCAATASSTRCCGCSGRTISAGTKTCAAKCCRWKSRSGWRSFAATPRCWRATAMCGRMPAARPISVKTGA